MRPCCGNPSMATLKEEHASMNYVKFLKKNTGLGNVSEISYGGS